MSRPGCKTTLHTKKYTITQIKTLAITLVSVLLIASISPFSFAADIPIEVYVENGVTLNTSGAWFTGLQLSQVGGIAEDTAYWEGTTSDYISFADDSSTTGFEINISLDDYTLTGQTPIPASNFSIIANIVSESPSTATKGYDDDSNTLSILPASCETATTNDFTFNSSLTSNTYTLQGSNTDQTLLTSTADCHVQGHLRFDRIELLVPAGTPQGTYSSTITLTIIDGII